MAEKDFYVVGIGISAGGQDPLLALISLLPPNLNASFVILPHLSRDHKSYLHNIIRKVARMPVIRVEQRELLRPGVIYVLPENKMMFMEQGFLVLRERKSEEKMNYAINVFFMSLAREAGEKAIGVILSGANDDGLLGANEINYHGGIILVQDALTAVFPRMPLEIINKDHPIEIKPPEELAQSLIRRTSGSDSHTKQQ